MQVKHFRERTYYQKIVCDVLARCRRQFLNNTWAADALPVLTRIPCLPTCLPFRTDSTDAWQGLFIILRGIQSRN